MRPFISLLATLPLLLLTGAALGASSGGERLWTVQAVRVDGSVVCDAFATGAAASDRIPYEIRFRRSNDTLLLIVSHDGPAQPPVRELTVSLDGQPFGTFPANALTFGTRAAVVTSLDPRSVDFKALQRYRLMSVTVGASRFDMGILPTDRLAEGMEACARFVKQAH